MLTRISTVPTHEPPGYWVPDSQPPACDNQALHGALQHVCRPVFLVDANGRPAVARNGRIVCDPRPASPDRALPICAHIPALHPASLGSPDFKQDTGCRFAYVIGAMANAITSVEMVAKAAQAGLLAVFGAGGLTFDQIDAAIAALQRRLGNLPYGCNLIHSPGDPELEAATARLFVAADVPLVSASAYLNLTAPLVYCRVKGIRRCADGRISLPRRMLAKVSRIEVARKFLSPPPERILRQLTDQGLISPQEAALAACVPLCDYLTAEADSGGHTDNRPAITLLPTMIALRNELAARYPATARIGVGLAGGIATPHAAAAAFAMGAAYVVAGSIHQACIEAGTSEAVRRMLAETHQADVAMAPAADMFEMGVKVQVLKRGTMFAQRAARLYDLYTTHERWEDIPGKLRRELETEIFHCPFDQAWEQTRDFFSRRDPRQIQMADRQPKHKMALVFRSYLGRASAWAVEGVARRRIDYQIWCGPAMGAFNQWTRGSFLAHPEARESATVAMNLLFGAAVLNRAHLANLQGVHLPAEASTVVPLEMHAIEALLSEHTSGQAG